MRKDKPVINDSDVARFLLLEHNCKTCSNRYSEKVGTKYYKCRKKSISFITMVMYMKTYCECYEAVNENCSS
jgi:hypothetical protein